MFGRGKIRGSPARSVAITAVFALLLILLSLCLFTASVRAAQQELSHDDGSSEFAFRAGAGVMGAVLFDAPSGALIRTLRFYVHGEGESVRVYVLNSSQQPVYSKDVFFPGGTGWFDVDISGDSVSVSGQFYVGWMWTSEHACPPCSWLNLDKNGPPQYRSYIGTPGHLTLVRDVPEDHGVRQENYMIRAVIETGEAPLSKPNQPPVACFSFSPSQPKVRDNVTFDASCSHDPDGWIVSYSYNFGDGATAVGKRVTHSYSKAKTYTVCLTVTDNKGATNKACKDINVQESPQPGQPRITIWQPGWERPREVTLIRSKKTAKEFYDYHSKTDPDISKRNNGYAPFMEEGVSKVYLYENTVTGELSLFIHHNKAGVHNVPMRVMFDFVGVPEGAYVSVSDDFVHDLSGFGGYCNDEKRTHEFDLSREPEGCWSFINHSDGGVLSGLPTNTDWSITIIPVDYGGWKCWQNIYRWEYQMSKASGKSNIVLDKTKPLTIEFRRGTSSGPRPVAYTDYLFAEPGPFFNQDMYFTWEDAPPNGYIYPAFQFSFQVSGGYMGVQLVGTSKKAIFSIWDTSDGSGTAQPVSDNCSRFGHEGTGTHCGIDYDWVEGREYRLRIWTVGTDATGESWIGAIYDTVTQQETTIGVIHLKSSNGYVGYGWLTDKAYTFLEYFSGPDSCEGQPYSRVLWRGPYANAGAYTASRAVVQYNDCVRTNVTTGGRPTAIQEAGTGVQRVTPPGTELWSSTPRINVEIEEAVAEHSGDPTLVEDADILWAIQLWVSGEEVPGTGGQTISDEKILELVRLWITGQPVSSSSAQSEPIEIGGTEGLTAREIKFFPNPMNNAATLAVKGSGIAGTKVEIFNLAGVKVFEQEASGDTLEFHSVDNEGRPLANGVYLYIVTIRGLDGEMIRSKVRKLIILR